MWRWVSAVFIAGLPQIFESLIFYWFTRPGKSLKRKLEHTWVSLWKSCSVSFLWRVLRTWRFLGNPYLSVYVMLHFACQGSVLLVARLGSFLIKLHLWTIHMQTSDDSAVTEIFLLNHKCGPCKCKVIEFFFRIEWELLKGVVYNISSLKVFFTDFWFKGLHLIKDNRDIIVFLGLCQDVAQFSCCWVQDCRRDIHCSSCFMCAFTQKYDISIM